MVQRKRLTSESGFEEGGEFDSVEGEGTDGGGGGGIAPGIERPATGNYFQMRRDIRPGTHVLGFFLAPHEPGMRIAIGNFGEPGN